MSPDRTVSRPGRDVQHLAPFHAADPERVRAEALDSRVRVRLRLLRILLERSLRDQRKAAPEGAA